MFFSSHYDNTMFSVNSFIKIKDQLTSKEKIEFGMLNDIYIIKTNKLSLTLLQKEF